jgi:XK-related protein
VDTVVFGLKCKWEKLEDDKKKWFRHKTWEETDSALLRLLECFMEAAPQLTLQLYIIAVQGIKEHFWLGNL